MALPGSDGLGEEVSGSGSGVAVEFSVGRGEGEAFSERDVGSPNVPRLGKVSMSRSAGSKLGVGTATGLGAGVLLL